MTRKIKASEVREGMEVEWSKEGITYQMQCQRKVEFKHAIRKDIIGYNFHTKDGGVKNISPDQTVTVLSEPQPDEPTAFGACVKAGEVRFSRISTRGSLMPWLSDGGGSRSWNELLSFGPVVIMCADPFANTEPREPRVWDQWADVPEMTPVRMSGTETPHRKVGHRIECRWGGSWEPAFTDEYELNKYAPFTEVLDA